jgi:hypothetical protein
MGRQPKEWVAEIGAGPSYLVCGQGAGDRRGGGIWGMASVLADPLLRPWVVG